MSILEFLGIVTIAFCVVLCIICIVVLDQVTTNRNHLRQIEKKIETLDTQMRVKDFTYPFPKKKSNLFGK